MRVHLMALSFVALLSFLASCSPVPFDKPQLVRTRALSAQELTAGHWFSGPAVYRFRQTVVFQWHGKKIPVEGFMHLDVAQKTARLLAMDGMGVKLFDLSVFLQGVEKHHVIPDLERIPHFAEAVGDSVRRIFLDPLPASDDVLEVEPRRYLITRSEDGKEMEFIFGGPREALLESSCVASDQKWRVRYFDHENVQGRMVPTGIVLDDKRAGYRLTLWLESVKKVNGQN